MKKLLTILFLILNFSSFGFAQIIRAEKELDLSLFLKPGWIRTFIVSDDLGNVFVSQNLSEEFIKIDKEGKIINAGPSEKEGFIIHMDVTFSGDPIIFFRATPGQRILGKPPYKITIYEGKTLNKKKEIDFSDLKNKFLGIADLKVLNPRNEILIRALRKEENFKNYSLHVMDFEGNILRSFSPFVGEITFEDIMFRSDIFSPHKLWIDPVYQRIFQMFPVSDKIKVFDYEGNQLDEMKWNKSEMTTFALYNGDMIIEYFPIIGEEEGKKKHKRDAYLIARKKGNKYILTGDKIEYDPKIDGILRGFDRFGNLYFLCGENRTILKVCRIY